MADSSDTTPFRQSFAASRGSPVQDEESIFKPSDKNRLLKVEKGEATCIQLTVDDGKIEGTAAYHIERHEAELSSLKNTDIEVRAVIDDLKRTLDEDKDVSAQRQSELQKRVSKMENTFGTMTTHVTKIADSETVVMREALKRLAQVESELSRLTIECRNSKTALNETKQKLSEMEEDNRAVKEENQTLKQVAAAMSDTMKLKVDNVEDDIKMLTKTLEKNTDNVEANKKTSTQIQAHIKLIMQIMESHMNSFVMFAEKVAHMTFGGRVNLGLDWMSTATWQLQAQMSTLSSVSQILVPKASSKTTLVHDKSESKSTSSSGPLSRPPTTQDQTNKYRRVADRIGALERSLSVFIELSQRHGNSEEMHSSLVTPAIFPNQYVGWLQQLDFRLPCGMDRFREVDVRVDKHMLLSYGNHYYYLQQISNIISHKEPVCLARNRRGLSDEDFYSVMDRPYNERVYKDTVMELTAKSTADQPSLASTGVSSMPRYVAVLGEVFREHEDPQLGGRTGYYLVMDVTTPAKALWLVFGYEYKARDEKIKRTPLVTQMNNQLCASIGCPGFDIAKVADNVKDWDKKSGIRLYDQPELDPSAMSQCIMDSARTAELVFTSPNLSSLLLVIHEGWQGYTDPSQNGTST